MPVPSQPTATCVARRPHRNVSTFPKLLNQFGIEHVAKQLALTLSGGEKRRLTIARSLVTKPSLLMLDEPFSGVDPIAVYDVQQIIKNLGDSGLAILITDHNVRETLNIVDRAYLIHEGKVVTRSQLLEHVWGMSHSPTTRTVDNFIVNLRKYFEEDPAAPRHFLSVRGAGYRFVSEGEEARSEPES